MNKLLTSLFLLVAAALPSFGAAGTESFNITNQVAAATVIVGNPTNAAGVLTGGPINVDNYTSIGITLAGANTIGGVTNIADAQVNPTTNFIQVNLVRAMQDPTTLNWETVNTRWSWKVGVNGTTRIVGTTNIDANIIGPARWIGIAIVTNTCSSGIFTNAVGGNILTVTKKIIPTTFP